MLKIHGYVWGFKDGTDLNKRILWDAHNYMYGRIRRGPVKIGSREVGVPAGLRALVFWGASYSEFKEMSPTMEGLGQFRQTNGMGCS